MKPSSCLLFENKIIPSNDRVVALGFSRKSWSSLAKSLSLITFKFGTDLVSTNNYWSLGMSKSPPGR